MEAAWTSLVAATATAFIALLFARAAWHKLSDFTAFTGFVADYDLMPAGRVNLAAMVLAGLEVLVVVVLLTPGGNVAGAILAIALLGLYAVGMGININRGRDRIECGCGGAVQPLGWQLVGRNGVLAAIAALCLVGSPYALSLSEAAAALVSGFILWVGYLLIEQIMATTAVMRLRR